MNKEIKTKWVTALRSGDYKQGKVRLRSKGKHCCLGVLCDIVDPTKWVVESFDNQMYSYDNYWGALSDDMCRVIDLDAEAQDKLIHMNDEENKTFLEIADYVEQSL